MEYNITSKKGSYKIDYKDSKGSEVSVNGEDFILDLQDSKTGFHIIHNGKGISVDVVEVNRQDKTVVLRIDSKRYSYIVKDRFEALLSELGMNGMASGSISEVKAPMPGLVLDVLVKSGDEVKIDQPLLILEAMKMENVIKSPVVGSIKQVSISKGDSVEKNHVLVEFE